MLSSLVYCFSLPACSFRCCLFDCLFDSVALIVAPLVVVDVAISVNGPAPEAAMQNAPAAGIQKRESSTRRAHTNKRRNIKHSFSYPVLNHISAHA